MFILFYFVEVVPYKVIVLPAIGKDVDIQLRGQDVSWKDFLSTVDQPFKVMGGIFSILDQLVRFMAIKGSL